MDTNRLQGEIVAVFKTQTAFAAAIGWHKNKVTKMLNNCYVPDVNEAANIALVLHLDEHQYCNIFLQQVSPICDNSKQKAV